MAAKRKDVQVIIGLPDGKQFRVTTEETKFKDDLFHVVVEGLTKRGKWEELWTFVANTRRDAHRMHKAAIEDLRRNPPEI